MEALLNKIISAMPDNTFGHILRAIIVFVAISIGSCLFVLWFAGICFWRNVYALYKKKE